MIAPKFVAPPTAPPRRAKHAAQRRRRRRRTQSLAVMLRVIAVAAIAVIPLVGYVWLTANVTGLSYAIAHEQTHRSALVEETMRLDDRLAQLAARERLAAVASRLGMSEPHIYAVVRIPDARPKPPPRGIAFLNWFQPH